MQETGEFGIARLVDLATKGFWTLEAESLLLDKEKEAPYASLVHILRAMHHDDPESRFRAAIFAPDRGRLKQLMTPHKVPLQSPVLAEPEAKPSPPQVDDRMNSIVVEEPVQLSLALSASAGLESNGSMFSIDMPQGDVLPKQTSLSWRFHIHPHEGDSSFSEVSDVMPVFIKLEKELQDLLFQSTPLQEQDLINNFLAKPPVSRTARREAPASPLEEDSRASSSITSDDSLVTETLAQLYLKQNHPSEAIRVYEQLCLRYPEKISYFTTQIQKIKENKL